MNLNDSTVLFHLEQSAFDEKKNTGSEKQFLHLIILYLFISFHAWNSNIDSLIN